MTPHDYDFLRKCLKQRSGLVLSADKQYLVESRLLPVARKAGLGSLGELVATLKRGNAEALMIAVVEAMMTNESFFFRDKTPFENFRSAVMPALHCSAAAFAHHSHLVCGGRRRPGAVFACHGAQGDGAKDRRLAHRGDRHRPLE